jgi:hypothetical protein
MLQAFLAEPGIEQLLAGSALRRVMTGGEALPVDLAERLHARFPEVRLCNQYGPTEAAVDVTAWTCEPGDTVVPIGRPLANTRILLRDREGRPVPIGIPGELAIGGVQVARGYLGRPDLTAERFLPDPEGEPGARLYRTGDLARHRHGGEIEYLGRIDHQVKIRGIRIELGEIETALAALPGVRQAVVLASGEGSDRRLVAYLTISGEAGEAGEAAPTPQTAAELRRSLGAVLPEAMIPAAFVVPDAFPLLPSGKVDRSALGRLAPSLDRAGSANVSGGEEGSASWRFSPVEEIVAGIWADVLGLARVGPEEDFFALGGHSLLATRVMSRVRAACSVELPLRTLFERPTVAGVAREVEAAHRVALPPIGRVSREVDLPLSFAQQRLWFVDQLDPGNPAYNIPLFLRLVGPLDVSALWAALAAVLHRHETLRSSFPTVRGAPFVEIAAEVPGGWPLVDHGALATASVTAANAANPANPANTELARLMLGEQGYRFDLERGPVLRAVLVRRGPEDHAVLLTLHHIAIDGWSLALLARELDALYTAAVEKRPQPLPELPVRYSDYAAWQRGLLRASLDHLLTYWTGKLAALPPALELPYDRPRPDLPGFRGAALPMVLPPEVARSARELARSAGATLFVVLLAGFKVFLAAITGERDLLVGSPVAGRTQAEIEPLIGMFMNTLVLRTDLSGDPTFREIVCRVRTTAFEAYDHQDLPFEKLVDAVLPEREAGRPPLSQVWFVLQNQEAPSLDLPRLRAEPLSLPPAFTKFDLALNLRENPTGISGLLEYSTDLFDEATARHLESALATLLARALADPELHLAELAGTTAAAFQALQAARRQDFKRSLRSSLMNVRRQPSAGFLDKEKKG